jgi:hypothetical protein
MRANESLTFEYGFDEPWSAIQLGDSEDEIRFYRRCTAARQRVWFVTATSAKGCLWEMIARDRETAEMIAEAGELTEDFEFIGSAFSLRPTSRRFGTLTTRT